MSVIAFTVIAVAALIFGFFVLIGVLVFVTHLIEKRPVGYLVPAPADDPEQARLAPPGASPRAEAGDAFNPYESPKAVDYPDGQNRSAAALGFTPHGLFVHKKGGTYKVHVALWTSPDRRTLAVIGWGTLAGVNASKTLLYSRTDDGKIVLTCDKLPGNNTPGLYEILVIQNSPLDALVRRHERRLATGGRAAIPFEGADALAEYEAVLARRHQFLVDRKDEYYLDPERTAVRSTLKGALKAYGRTWVVPDYVERIPRPGADPVPVGRGARDSPAALRYAQWFFTFIIVFGFVLNARSPTRTLSQSLFRLGLFAFGVLGSLTVWIAQVLIKRQNTPR